MSCSHQVESHRRNNRRHFVEQHTPHSHRTRDVPERLFAAILVSKRKSIAYLRVHVPEMQMPPGSARLSRRAATLTLCRPNRPNDRDAGQLADQ